MNTSKAQRSSSMATSLFFMPTDQNSVADQSDLLRNTHLGVNSSSEIQTEPRKSRGRKPGPKTTSQQHPKKQKRGMGVAKLERLRIKSEEEKNKLVGDTSATDSISRLPLPIAPDPVVVLQGFPSSIGGCRSNRIYCGGVGSGQIMIDPVWSFVETSSTHELSSISNPSHQMYNASHNRCDTCFKKKRFDGDQNVVRSNGGDFSKYTMIPPVNGYDHHPLQPDQRSQELFYDHRVAKAASSFASNTINPYFNEVTKTTGTMEEFGSYMEGNPRNESGGVKQYEFFPGKYENFPGNFGVRASSVATSVVDECSPDTSSTIDLSLKL